MILTRNCITNNGIGRRNLAGKNALAAAFVAAERAVNRFPCDGFDVDDLAAPQFNFLFFILATPTAATFQNGGQFELFFLFSAQRPGKRFFIGGRNESSPACTGFRHGVAVAEDDVIIDFPVANRDGDAGLRHNLKTQRVIGPFDTNDGRIRRQSWWAGARNGSIVIRCLADNPIDYALGARCGAIRCQYRNDENKNKNFEKIRRENFSIIRKIEIHNLAL